MLPISCVVRATRARKKQRTGTRLNSRHQQTNKQEKTPTTIKTENNNSKPAATNARYRVVVGEFEHAERVVEKKNRVEVLRALLEMHQQQHKLDLEYIKGLRQRLKQAQTQLQNMRPF
jgi:hypothetical protein